MVSVVKGSLLDKGRGWHLFVGIRTSIKNVIRGHTGLVKWWVWVLLLDP